MQALLAPILGMWVLSSPMSLRAECNHLMSGKSVHQWQI